jgi:hypothetical protein
MKKFFSILLLFISASGFCQKRSAKEIIRTAADLKTGNSQDVLTSFFQLALEDITGEEKTFRFQSSLFAIKARTDSNLLIDTSFLRQTHARNLVFSIAPSLDTNLHFSKSSFGIKYALVNNRDKAVFDFVLPDEAEWLSIQRTVLEQYAHQLPGGVRDEHYILARNFFVDKNDEEEPRTSWNDLPAEFKKLLRAALAESRTFRLTTPQAFRDTLSVEYSALARYMENRSLWTLTANVSNERSGRFSGAVMESEFLKGILKRNSRMNLELGLHGTMNFEKDTSRRKGGLGRKLLSLAGGFNWIIIKNANAESLLEFRAALAWNRVLAGSYAGEEVSQFSGEGTIRIRITNDFWIPVDLRYDPGSGRFLGFLSVRVNFDGLGRSK